MNRATFSAALLDLPYVTGAHADHGIHAYVTTAGPREPEAWGPEILAVLDDLRPAGVEVSLWIDGWRWPHPEVQAPTALPVRSRRWRSVVARWLYDIADRIGP